MEMTNHAGNYEKNATDKDYFRDLLKTMINLDYDVVKEALVAHKDPWHPRYKTAMEEWHAFRVNPWQWFILADKPTSDIVWDKMMERWPRGVSIRYAK